MYFNKEVCYEGCIEKYQSPTRLYKSLNTTVYWGFVGAQSLMGTIYIVW